MHDRGPADLDARLLGNCAAFDGRMSEPLVDAGILVRGGRIAAIGPVDEVRDAASGIPFVDLDGATVVPGMCNMHSHFGGGVFFRPRNAAECAFVMAENSRRALQVGVTSVRLAGEPFGADLALRAAIREGRVPGPRIFTAGVPVMSTGGHAHEAFPGAGCSGPAEFRRAVRTQISAGADFVKLMLSGGIAGEYERIHTPQIAADELEAVLEVAHAWDRKVTAHAGPGPVIADAVERGLDCVEHGYQLDDAAVDALARHEKLLVPTLDRKSVV